MKETARKVFLSVSELRANDNCTKIKSAFPTFLISNQKERKEKKVL